MELHVQGFDGHLVALNGVYNQHATQNHGKNQYVKKTTEIEGCTESCIYFWDARDGDSMSGWWIAPIVGGEQVWSFNPAKAMTPPVAGWRVPWHEATPKPQIKLTLRTAAKRPQSSPEGPASKVQKTESGAGAAGGGVAAAGAAGGAVAAGATGGAAQKPAPASTTHPQLAIRQKKILDNLDGQIGNIEKAVQKVKAKDVNSEDPVIAATAKKMANPAERQRAMQVAKNSITSTKRFIESQRTQMFTGAESSKLDPILERMTKAENDLKEEETAYEESMKKDWEKMKEELPVKCKDFLATIEQNVENTKDETVMLTCELGEHSSPEDILEVDEKANKTTQAAIDTIKLLKEYLNEAASKFRIFAAYDTENLKEIVVNAQKGYQAFERELAEVRRVIMPAIQKAKATIAAKKAEIEKEKKKQEALRLQELARQKSARSYEVCMFSEHIIRKISSKPQSETSLREIEAHQKTLIGLYDRLEADFTDKDTQNSVSLRQVLQKSLQRVKRGLNTLAVREKDVTLAMYDQGDKFAVFLSSEIAAKMKKDGKTELELFKEANTNGSDPNVLSYDTFIKWCKNELLKNETETDDDKMEKMEKNLNQYVSSVWRRAITSRKRSQMAETKPFDIIYEEIEDPSGAKDDDGNPKKVKTPVMIDCPSGTKDADGQVKKVEKTIEKVETEEDKEKRIESIMSYECGEEESLKESITVVEWILFIIQTCYIVTSQATVSKSKEIVEPQQGVMRKVKTTKMVEVEVKDNDGDVVMMEDGNAKKEMVEKEEEEEVEDFVGTLDVDDVVCVLNGPLQVMITQDSGSTGVFRVLCERIRDGLKGWVSIRDTKAEFDNVEKYSNSYVIMQETVLTNTYELKEFRVIRRVKKGERVMAISAPQYNRETELLRVKVKAVQDGASGWITVKGSHGTLFLRSLVVQEALSKQAKTKNSESGNLNFNKDPDTGKMYLISEVKENKNKMYGRIMTDEILDDELTKIADELPDQALKRFAALEEVRNECDLALNKMKSMDKSTEIPLEESTKFLVLVDGKATDSDGNLVDESALIKIPFPETTGNNKIQNPINPTATTTDSSASPVGGVQKKLWMCINTEGMSNNPNFESDINDFAAEADTAMKKINGQVQAIKQELNSYFMDMSSVKLSTEAAEYLRYKKQEDAKHREEMEKAEFLKEKGGKKVDADGDVEMMVGGNEKEDNDNKGNDDEKVPQPPNENEMSPMVRLKYRLMKLSREMEFNAEFIKKSQRTKLTLKEKLNKKFLSFKKNVELKDFEKTVAELGNQVTQKTKELEELVHKKLKLYSEITGEETENNISGGGDKKDGEDVCSADNLDSSVDSSSKKKMLVTEKPVHSASKIAQLGIEFENLVSELEHFSEVLTEWLIPNDPTKLVTCREKWSLLLNNERVKYITDVHKPYLGLKHKNKQLKDGFSIDRDFLANNLQQDILLRSRTEIATYFRQNDPKIVFCEELMGLNEKNNEIESLDEKFITCDIVCNYMEKALSPNPVPKSIIQKIYSVLVGNIERPMCLEEFSSLFAKMHYRVIKDTLMTDAFDLEAGPFKKLCRLGVGEIVRLIGDVKKTPSGMMRFEAETAAAQQQDQKDNDINNQQVDQEEKKIWLGNSFFAKGNNFFRSTYSRL